MTREDLELRVSEICVAANLPPTMSRWIHSTEATRQILALIDRYEDEKWKPVTEPPDDDRPVLLWRGQFLGLSIDSHNPDRPMCSDGTRANGWLFTNRKDAIAWRELPQPPKWAPDADALDAGKDRL